MSSSDIAIRVIERIQDGLNRNLPGLTPVAVKSARGTALRTMGRWARLFAVSQRRAYASLGCRCAWCFFWNRDKPYEGSFHQGDHGRGIVCTSRLCRECRGPRSRGLRRASRWRRAQESRLASIACPHSIAAGSNGRSPRYGKPWECHARGGRYRAVSFSRSGFSGNGRARQESRRTGYSGAGTTVSDLQRDLFCSEADIQT